MKTFPNIIIETREFVCEEWGKDEETVTFYAPLTRVDGVVWIHPAWAREAPWAAITARADRIWRVSGSFWNPIGFRLIWNAPCLRPKEVHL
jgi:hypothetical protein